ncbi:MAG: hypothetical protein GEU79_16055 [Acidimicrobiia bacterium]|nr:hypothetical protein [Acidimicrobiia bacterium]
MRELRPRSRNVALLLVILVAILGGCTSSPPASDDAISEEPLVFLRGAGQGPPPDPAVLDSNEAIETWLAKFEDPLRTQLDDALSRGTSEDFVMVGWAPTGCLEDRSRLFD